MSSLSGYNYLIKDIAKFNSFQHQVYDLLEEKVKYYLANRPPSNILLYNWDELTWSYTIVRCSTSLSNDPKTFNLIVGFQALDFNG